MNSFENKGTPVLNDSSVKALINTLSNPTTFGIIGDIDGATEMIKKIKEEVVRQNHLTKQGKVYAINEMTCKVRGKEVTRWVTRAPWKGKDAKIMKSTREEVIDELYKHYCGDFTDDITLEDVFVRWIENRQASKLVSPLTIEHYRADWDRYMGGRPLTKKELSAGKRQFNRSELLEKKISEISVQDLRKRYEYLVGDGQVTRSAFTNLVSVIRGVFSYAFDNGIECIDASRVSTKRLRFKQPADNSDDVYTPEERQKLLGYLEGLEKQTVYSLSIRLMFCLCCRIGELRALQWSDFIPDSPNGPALRLSHQMVDKETDEHHRVATYVDYMKGRSTMGKRLFPLSEYAVEVLAELKKLNPTGAFICSSGRSENPITTNNFNEHLKKYCEAAGIRYLSSHKIRFYAVSQMYDMGVDEKDIMKLAGHSNPTTTRHYNRRLKAVNISEEQLNWGFGGSGNGPQKPE